MKIERVLPQAAVQAYSPVKRTQAAAGSFAAALDQVEVSQDAMVSANAIQRVKQSLAEPTAQQIKRRQQVISQVRSGQYDISAQDVASKILSGAFFDAVV